MKKKFYFILVFVIAIIGLVFYILNSQYEKTIDKNKKQKMNVIVSILPQKTFVEAVAGDLARVKVLIPPGGSPATYELRPSDLVNIEKADIYFRIGYIPFEKANLDKLISLNKKMKVVDTSREIKLRHFKSSGAIDPHIWVAPLEVKKQIDIIEKTFKTEDPEHADIYKKNADKFREKLDKLNVQLKFDFANLKNNKIMVFHPSWGYFADDYGLEQIAIEDSGKEPTAEQLRKIINRAKKENIKVIFVQSQFNEAVAKSIAREIGATVISIDPLAENYIDNLGSIAKTISDNLK